MSLPDHLDVNPDADVSDEEGDIQLRVRLNNIN